MTTRFPDYPFAAELTAQGHLIDSGIMSSIMDTIIKCRCKYEIAEFTVGKTNEDVSRTRFTVFAASDAELKKILEGLHGLGCFPTEVENVLVKPSPKDWVVPDDFYSTTNLRTEVRLDGKWHPVSDQRMDAVLVCRKEGGGWQVACRKLRHVKKGDLVACGFKGIRLHPEFKERDPEEFGFMNSEVSSERRVRIAVKRVARWIRDVRQTGRRIGVTAGPVVIHTGGGEFLARLIREGWVDFILSGNALAVHDIEQNLFRTSLGIDVESGTPVENGHRNHMRAINTVFRHGSIKQAVEDGVLTQGIFHECIRKPIPFVLAGSIRDDGPLPEVVTDMVEAQAGYFRELQNCGMMLILSSMLHGIGVGNMLPGAVRTVCVDINPAVVTKLADRGSHQTVGIVTEVGTFLATLYDELHRTEDDRPLE